MNNSKTCRAIVFAVLLVIVPLASNAGDTTTETEPLRVLSESFAPFLFVDENGRPAGLEHKILESFAKTEGRTLEVVWVEDFDTIIDALERGDGDVISSTMTITTQRQERVDFSTPYFSTRVVLVQRQGSGLTDPGSLSGKTALTIAGTTYEEFLKTVDGVELVYVDTEENMYLRLAAGEADALATDSANFLWVGREYPNLEIGQVLSDRQFYGFAVRKGDPLKTLLDAHIEKLLEDETYWVFLREAFGEVVAGHIEALKEDFLSDGKR